MVHVSIITQSCIDMCIDMCKCPQMQASLHRRARLAMETSLKKNRLGQMGVVILSTWYIINGRDEGPAVGRPFHTSNTSYQKMTYVDYSLFCVDARFKPHNSADSSK